MNLMTLTLLQRQCGFEEAEIQNSFFTGDLFSLPTSVTSGLPTHHFMH